MGLRLGTFNVWGLPKPFADDPSVRSHAIARNLLELDVDVLLIQEAWTDEMRDSLRIAALEAGFEVALPTIEADEASSDEWEQVGKYGNSTVSVSRIAEASGDPKRLLRQIKKYRKRRRRSE